MNQRNNINLISKEVNENENRNPEEQTIFKLCFVDFQRKSFQKRINSNI